MDYQKIERCEVCGARAVLGLPVCSIFGAQTFACCEACLAIDKEPYRAIVNYISAAGHWPQDINDIYQAEVRHQLKLHGVPEEVFKLEVERAIAEKQAFISELCAGKVYLTDVMEGEF